MVRGSRLTLGLLVATAGFLLAACGGVPQGAVQAPGDDCPSGSDCYDPVTPVGPGSELTVQAFEWGFDLTGGTAVDGPITVNLENIGGTEHDFTIDAAAGEARTITAPAGETASGELLLFGGQEYTFYCSIPGHRQQGMEGTLRVALPDEEVTDLGADAGEETTDEPAPEPAGGDGGTGTPTPAGTGG